MCNSEEKFPFTPGTVRIRVLFSFATASWQALSVGLILPQVYNKPLQNSAKSIWDYLCNIYPVMDIQEKTSITLLVEKNQ